MKIIKSFIGIIKYLFHQQISKMEKNHPHLARFQNERRFKKFDKHNDFGINSRTNPYLYQFLINCRNLPCLTDFELDGILILFRFEKFGLIEKKEVDVFTKELNFNFMQENIEDLRKEALNLFQANNQKYFGTVMSFEIFDNVVSQMRPYRSQYERDEVRNIKKWFCELRHLLNDHILDPYPVN